VDSKDERAEAAAPLFGGASLFRAPQTNLSPLTFLDRTADHVHGCVCKNWSDVHWGGLCVPMYTKDRPALLIKDNWFADNIVR